uniref:Uncharacterized protein n=1 Tax=Oncorhynchus tshawytscha TaxID=74940 RepID=A0A8C8EFY5_ONCTS
QGDVRGRGAGGEGSQPGPTRITSPFFTSSFEFVDMEPTPPLYQPVQPHWFYCHCADSKDLWLPICREDSERQEQAWSTGE